MRHIKISVDDLIYSIMPSPTVIKIKDENGREIEGAEIKAALFDRQEIIVDKIERHPTMPEKYLKVYGRDKSGREWPIDFPKVNDTPSKVTDRFFDSEEEVNKEIRGLLKIEVARVEAIIQALQEQLSLYSDAIQIHS